MTVAFILMGAAVVLLGLIVVLLGKKVNRLEKTIASLAVILEAKTGFLADDPRDIVKKAFHHE